MLKEDKVFKRVSRLADIVLTSVGVGCTLVWVYFIYYYVWTGERQFTSAAGIVLYLAVPALLAVLMFASLGLKSIQKINLSILCVSFGISLYGVELFLGFAGSKLPHDRAIWGLGGLSKDEKNEVVTLAKQFGVNFDARDRLEVVSELRDRGFDAVPVVFPRLLLGQANQDSLKSVISIRGTEVLPLSGISNKVTVLCNESGEHSIYKSDEHGFHNPKGLWTVGRIKVAAVGDSFTQGFCLPSNQNFVALIRKAYPATLNLGMGGNGPLLNLSALKEYLPQLTPKVVLWFHFEGNDLSDLNKESKSPLLARYMEDNFKQDLRALQNSIDESLTDYVDTAITSARNIPNNRTQLAVNTSLDFLKLATLRQRSELVFGRNEEQSEIAASEFDLFRKILVQARNSVSAWDGLLYFVYLPSWGRYANHSRDADNARGSVLAMVRALDIPIIDIHSVFQAQADPLSSFPFRRFYHYNEKGHRLVAETVLKSISLSGLIAD